MYRPNLQDVQDLYLIVGIALYPLPDEGPVLLINAFIQKPDPYPVAAHRTSE